MKSSETEEKTDKGTLIVDGSEDSIKAIEIVCLYLPDCAIKGAEEEECQPPLLQVSGKNIQGYGEIHSYLTGWGKSEPRIISTEQAAKLNGNTDTSPFSVELEPESKEPEKLTDFCCPICGSNKCTPIYSVHKSGISAPGFKSYSHSSISEYQCDKCSVRFGDPGLFNEKNIMS